MATNCSNALSIHVEHDQLSNQACQKPWCVFVFERGNLNPQTSSLETNIITCDSCVTSQISQQLQKIIDKVAIGSSAHFWADVTVEKWCDCKKAQENGCDWQFCEMKERNCCWWCQETKCQKVQNLHHPCLLKMWWMIFLTWRWVATPQFACKLAGHGASSHGTHRVVSEDTRLTKMRFSACGTSSTTASTLCNSKEACSKEQGTIVSRRWSACHDGHVFQTVTIRTRDWQWHELSSLSKSQWSQWLACRFFTQKHRWTQKREDRAEDLESNLSQMSHSFWLHSKAHNLHLQTTQKACSFWRSAVCHSITKLKKNNIWKHLMRHQCKRKNFIFDWNPSNRLQCSSTSQLCCPKMTTMTLKKRRARWTISGENEAWILQFDTFWIFALLLKESKKNEDACPTIKNQKTHAMDLWSHGLRIACVEWNPVCASPFLSSFFGKGVVASQLIVDPINAQINWSRQKVSDVKSQFWQLVLLKLSFAQCIEMLLLLRFNWKWWRLVIWQTCVRTVVQAVWLFQGRPKCHFKIVIWTVMCLHCSDPADMNWVGWTGQRHHQIWTCFCLCHICENLKKSNLQFREVVCSSPKLNCKLFDAKKCSSKLIWTVIFAVWKSCFAVATIAVHLCAFGHCIEGKRVSPWGHPQPQQNRCWPAPSIANRNRCWVPSGANRCWPVLTGALVLQQSHGWFAQHNSMWMQLTSCESLQNRILHSTEAVEPQRKRASPHDFPNQMWKRNRESASALLATAPRVVFIWILPSCSLNSTPSTGRQNFGIWQNVKCLTHWNGQVCKEAQMRKTQPDDNAKHKKKLWLSKHTTKTSVKQLSTCVWKWLDQATKMTVFSHMNTVSSSKMTTRNAQLISNIWVRAKLQKMRCIFQSAPQCHNVRQHNTSGNWKLTVAPPAQCAVQKQGLLFVLLFMLKWIVSLRTAAVDGIQFERGLTKSPTCAFSFCQSSAHPCESSPHVLVERHVSTSALFIANLNDDAVRNLVEPLLNHSHDRSHDLFRIRARDGDSCMPHSPPLQTSVERGKKELQNPKQQMCCSFNWFAACASAPVSASMNQNSCCLSVPWSALARREQQNQRGQNQWHWWWTASSSSCFWSSGWLAS